MAVIIEGFNLNVNKRLAYSLTAIRGIGLSRAKVICNTLGFEETAFLKDLTEAQILDISALITADYSGEVGSNLARLERERISALTSLGSYRGLRHRKMLPVRGQRTNSNAKTRRGKAGVKGLSGKKSKK